VSWIREEEETMDESPTLRKIKEQFPESNLQTQAPLGQDTVVVEAPLLVQVAEFLKEDPELQFNYLMDVTAVDFWKEKPRFEVVYHFFSLEKKLRLRVKVPVEEEVDSLCSLWPSANWFEREVYDMFGVKFRGHPNLSRILMYPEFEGHPLRKDYPIDKRQPLIGPRD
jgi:NADH-quinone oxidoreductase subunit C